MRHFKFVNFEKLIYMKLCSLLILTKDTKKSKKTVLKHRKRVKKLYCHVNKTSQQYTALYTTFSHALDGEIRTIAANWCLVVRTWGDTPATLIVCPTLGRRHQHVAQCCRNIQPSFGKCLGIQKVCLGFKRFHRNVDMEYFKKS